jgi:hypothetical protein
VVLPARVLGEPRGRPAWVRSTEIACGEHRGGHELDVVVASSAAGGPHRTAEQRADVELVDFDRLHRGD